MSSQLNKIFIPHNWSLPSNASTSSWPEFLFLTSFPLPVSLSVTLFALSVCLSISLHCPSVCHSLCAICLHVTLFALSACMSLSLRYLPVCHSLCDVWLSDTLFALPVSLSVTLFASNVCQSVTLFALSVCLSVTPVDPCWSLLTVFEKRQQVLYHSTLVYFFSTLRLFPWLSATGQVTCKVFFYWQLMYIFSHRWAKLTERVSSI